MDKTGEAFIDLDENQLKAWGGDYREALRFFEKNWIEAETEAYGMGVGSISGSLSLSYGRTPSRAAAARRG